MNLTHHQLIHRAYLGSPLWKKKRLEALEHHGAICARCGSHGTDVHHKTYERTGGNELMTDLEILCRPCHETHHRVERATRGSSKRKTGGIRLSALARYLTPKQRTVLQERFGMSWVQIYTAIVSNDHRPVIQAALEMVGKTHAYFGRRSTGNNYNGWKAAKHHAKLMG